MVHEKPLHRFVCGQWWGVVGVGVPPPDGGVVAGSGHVEDVGGFAFGLGGEAGVLHPRPLRVEEFPVVLVEVGVDRACVEVAGGEDRVAVLRPRVAVGVGVEPGDTADDRVQDPQQPGFGWGDGDVEVPDLVRLVEEVT